MKAASPSGVSMGAEALAVGAKGTTSALVRISAPDVRTSLDMSAVTPLGDRAGFPL
ncbi:hypothetical protein GCM10009603_14360 [Nocardiopsis exhalans]